HAAVELERPAMTPQERRRRYQRAPDARWLGGRTIVEQIVFVEADDDEVRFERLADLEQLFELLPRVVAGNRRVPHLPVHVGVPRLQLLLEQIGIGVLINRSVSERHRVAEAETP